MKKSKYISGICCIIIASIPTVTFAYSDTDTRVNDELEPNISEQLIKEGEIQHKISLAIDSASKTYGESEFDVWQSGTYPNLTVNVRSENDAVLTHFSHTLEPSGISVIKLTQTPLGANPEELIAPELKTFFYTEPSVMGYSFDIKTGQLVVDIDGTKSFPENTATTSTRQTSNGIPIRFRDVGK